MTSHHSTTNPGIVVGVDGCAASAAALRRALTRAVAEHDRITAVEVQPPERFLPGTSYALAPHGTAPPAERLCSRLHQIVVETGATAPGAPEVVELHLHGDPATELARVGGNASMLVLGYTPHSGVAEFVLGGVTAACLRHVGRPVVLVPVDAPTQCW